MSIVFVNDGEIDIRSVTTFGMSVKAEGAIGYFGTGLKMAISVILRGGGEITVWSGTTKYEFSTVKETVRGKDFDIVTVNGETKGFTTENAKDWEYWMSVREILCNCTDEQGSHYETDEEFVGVEGKTIIVVSDCDFEEAYHNRNSFLIGDRKLLWSTPVIDVYAGSGSGLFYKGILVHSSEEEPYYFTYNLKSSQALTEDRTLKYVYSAECEIGREIQKCEDKSIINSIVSCGDSYREYGMTYYETHFASEYLKSKVLAMYGKVDTKCPPSLQANFKPSLQLQLQNKEGLTLTKQEVALFNKALSFLKGMKISEEEYSIKFVDDLGEGIYGLADQEGDIIYISRLALDKGLKFLIETLYEEYIHVRFNVKDYTRDFQDLVIGHLIKAHAELQEEVL